MAETTSKPTASVTPSLRALLSEIVDYAGIFPPAALPLEQAIENHASYRISQHAWMLARLIIPAKRLQDLDEHAHLFETSPPFRFSVLSTGDGGNDFLDALESDLTSVQRFLTEHEDLVAVDQYEMRLPKEFIDTDVVRVRRFLNDVDEVFERSDIQHVDVFVEIPLDEFLRQTLSILTGAVAGFNRERSPDGGRACVKMRTGGTEAHAFPSVEDVAHVIVSCRNANVPFKATAGLHHPVRRFDESLETPVHGFLNLFSASVLASAHELDEGAVASIMYDDDPARFVFTEDGLEWQHLSADVRQIERARSSLALSFGSCSFEEPLEDLRALDLL